MKSVYNWLDEYGESHQNPLNKKIHWVCVPAIMFSVMGLWWSIPHGVYALYYQQCSVKLGDYNYCSYSCLLYTALSSDGSRYVHYWVFTLSWEFLYQYKISHPIMENFINNICCCMDWTIYWP